MKRKISFFTLILISIFINFKLQAQCPDHYFAEGMRSWQSEIEVADRGDTTAILTVAYNYQYGPFKIRDYDKAIFYYKKLPTSPEALYELGNIYSYNPYDEDKCREYYTESASYDYIPALKALADFYNHWTGNEFEAKILYNKIIFLHQPGDYTHVDEYVGSIIALYENNKYKSNPNNAEKDRLSKLMNDKNEAVYLWRCPTAALYEFNTTDKARLSSDILERLYGPLSSNPQGVDAILYGSYSATTKEQLLKSIEKKVADRIKCGGSDQSDINLREIAYKAATYLADKKKFKRAFNLLKWAADNGSIDAAITLAYFAYGNPSGEFGDGKSPWPVAYRNAKKAKYYKGLVEKYGYNGPSGY